jgi:hypothetical protein
VPLAAQVRGRFVPSGLPAAGRCVIEQMTCLLFIKRLDELHTLEERKSQALRC